MNATVIYIDYLFAINFCFDLLCLYAACAVCREKPKLLRLLAGSALGGAYAVLALYLEALPAPFGYAVHIAAAILICISVFGYSTPKQLLKALFSFWMSSLVLGGGVVSACMISGNYAQFGKVLYFDFDGASLILTALPLSLAVYIFARIVSARISIKSTTVFISRGGKEIKVEALYDTGNVLTDTLTALPIALVKSQKLVSLFSASALSALERRDAQSGDFPIGIRLIPTTHGLLSVFTPDKVCVLDRRSKKRNISVLIGIDFTSGSFAGLYALMPAID